MATRDQWLDALVPDRKCPLCKETKLKSRQWVILVQPGETKLSAICRACVWARGWKPGGSRARVASEAPG